MMINVINQWIFVGYHIFKQTQILSSSIDVFTGTKKTAKVLKLLVFSSFSFGLKCSWADSKGTQEHWWQLFLIVNTQLGSGPHGFSLAPGFLPSFASVCFTPAPAESSGCVGASSGLVPWTPLLSAETNDPPSPAGPSGAAAGDWRSASPTLAAPTLASPTLASTTLTCPAPLPPCTTGAGGRFHRGTKIGAAGGVTATEYSRRSVQTKDVNKVQVAHWDWCKSSRYCKPIFEPRLFQKYPKCIAIDNSPGSCLWFGGWKSPWALFGPEIPL